MENKKPLYIGAIIVVVILVIAAIFLLGGNSEVTGTSIEVQSNDTLANGQNFTVKLLDANGQPIANEQVDVTIVAVNGDKNVLNLITDSNGIATFQLNGVNEGDYTFECHFNGNAQNPAIDLSVPVVVNDTATA